MLAKIPPDKGVHAVHYVPVKTIAGMTADTVPCTPVDFVVDTRADAVPCTPVNAGKNSPFDAMPSEIVLQIAVEVNYMSVGDQRNFAYTCKRHYIIIRPFLFKRLDSRMPMALLAELLLDPVLGLESFGPMVKEMTLGDRTPVVAPILESNPRGQRRTASQHLLDDHLLDCYKILVEERRKDKTGMPGQIFPGSPTLYTGYNVMAAGIIFLVQKIRKLTIQNPFWLFPQYSPDDLSELTELECKYDNVLFAWAMCGVMNILQAAPNLRKLNCYNTFTLPTTWTTESLVSLKLEWCSISPIDLTSALSSFHNLETLWYESSTSGSTTPYDMQMALKGCRDTLKHLYLDFSRMDTRSLPSLCNLHFMHVLETLEIETQALWPDKSSSNGYEIIHLLPPSIESLGFMINKDRYRQYRDLAWNLGGFKRYVGGDCFPRLKSFQQVTIHLPKSMVTPWSTIIRVFERWGFQSVKCDRVPLVDEIWRNRDFQRNSGIM